MTTARRIAASVLVAVLSAGFVGVTSSSANAGDTTWGTSIKGR